MPYASTFVRSAGVAAIPIVCNEQVSPRREHPGARPDAVLEAMAEVVRNQLGSAASNENLGLDARQRRARSHRPDRDADIIALIDRGDEDRAIRQLFERHGPAVLRYATTRSPTMSSSRSSSKRFAICATSSGARA